MAAAASISEAYLLPVVGEMLAGFPFEVLGFHSDGGGEYVNHDVAKLSEKLRVEFTRSRPRHTNDNALVESKNGSVIRKQFGYAPYRPTFRRRHERLLPRFPQPLRPLAPSLLFRQSKEVDAKGKVRKGYPHQLIMTPFDKLKMLSPQSFNLRPGIILTALDAKLVRWPIMSSQGADARSKLFRSTHRRSKAAA